MEMTKETLKMIEQIVTDYGKIIERTSWMVYGVPESILPYSKEMIKSAIINWLKIEKDESAKKNLRFGYSHLATFIPDYEANISVRAVIAIESRDPFHPNFDCIRESVNIQNNRRDGKINGRNKFNLNDFLDCANYYWMLFGVILARTLVRVQNPVSPQLRHKIRLEIFHE